MGISVKRVKAGAVIAGSALVLYAATEPAGAQSPAGASLFEKRCYSCHNIGGGDKKGPDLKGVTTRQTREWLGEFIKSPAGMNRRGDPTAAALFKKFAPEVMPEQELTDEQIEGILAVIDDLSNKNQQFIPAGAKLSRPIAAGDIEGGLALFTGRASLQNGGAACIACHGIEGVGALGGGTLGPSLSAVNVKYRDPELISILQNPNFPTMNSVFGNRPLTEEEVVQLFALFQRTKPAAQVAQGAPPVDTKFPLIGFGALVLALAGMSLAWKKRLRGVREELVRRNRL